MTFPLEQALVLADANRQFALKFFDIVRTSGVRQAAIGAHALAAVFDPGKLSGVAQEIEQNRQTQVAETRAALEEWQESAGYLFSPEDETVQLAIALEPWRALLLSPFQAFAGAATPVRDTPASSATLATST